jgi:hypothetical protein
MASMMSAVAAAAMAAATSFSILIDPEYRFGRRCYGMTFDEAWDRQTGEGFTTKSEAACRMQEAMSGMRVSKRERASDRMMHCSFETASDIRQGVFNCGFVTVRSKLGVICAVAAAEFSYENGC